MRRVHKLTEKEYEALEKGYKNGEKHHFRVRCKAILLSNEDISVAEISNRLNKGKDAIYNLLNRYEADGIKGLRNRAGQGKKATLGNLSKEDEKALKEAVDNEPQNLNKVSGHLGREFGVNVSKWMLIQYLKKN